VLFSPAEAFRAILAKPSFVLPLLLMIGLNAGFTAIWMQKVDRHEFMKAQIDASPRADQIPADRKAEIIEAQAKTLPIFAWLGPFVFTPLTVLILGGIFLFVYRFFYGADVSFKQSITVLCWTMGAVGVVTVPLLLAVLAMKGDWNINPQEALQANLTLFLDKGSAARPLWSFASSIDLFSAWMAFLLATGFGAAAKRTAGWAAAGVLLPWGLWILVKVGFSMLF
jgi:hypothetical protein